jgi:uncharacterized protein (DUF952 family)
MKENFVYHLATPEQWAAAQERGVYEHPSLAMEGFIHTSTVAQIEKTANRYYLSFPSLFILYVRIDEVPHPLIFESSSSGEMFPHIYGPIPLKAITRAREVKRTEQGIYSFEV